MNTLTISPVFILLNVILAFLSWRSAEEISRVTEIRLELSSASRDSVNAADVFSAVEYIPLETTEESAFGFIYQLEFSKDYIFILDKMSSITNGIPKSSILIFTKEGKYHAQINNFRSSFFAIDQLKERILIRDESSAKMSYYDFDGKLLRSLLKPLLSATRFAFLDDDYIAQYRAEGLKMSKNDIILSHPELHDKRLIITKKEMQPVNGYMPIDTVALGKDPIFYTIGKSFYYSDDRYFIPTNQYQIYNFDEKGMTAVYSFVFPAYNMLPPNYLSLPKIEREKLYSRNKYVISGLSDFYKASNSLVFKINYSGSSVQTFIYNLQNQGLILFTNIKPDSSNFNLPIGQEILGSDHGMIYSFTSARSILNQIRLSPNASKQKGFPAGLSGLPLNKGKQINPVLVRCKLK